ncbi:MAG: LCP family protein [Ruminococcus sp.]|nr:LCP family protein [Ruminococcus sp.]
MTDRFQNEENTDNENTMNIPIPPNLQNYRRPNLNRQQNYQSPRQNNRQQQNNTNYYQNNSSYQNQNYRRQYNPESRQYSQNYSDNANRQYNAGYQNPNYSQYSQNYQQYSTGGYQNTNYQRRDYPQQRQSPPPPRRKKKRKHKSFLGRIIRKIVLTLFTILVLLFAIYSCTALTVISKVGKEETGDRNRTASAMSRNYVKSVLIIGTDGRSDNEQGRSDSMILLSFNSRTNEIILTSFMRDCYVNIQNYGMDKLNAAYSYGGAELLMDTIESNFMVEIDDYITVNFVSFAGIIDAVGGIDIDVSDEEAHEINNILFSEVNQLMGDDQWADFLESGGKLHLNGKQALSYARIRYVGNSDFERTSRQREVFEKIIPKAINPVAIGRIAKSVIPKINTNMSTMGMYLLSLRLPTAIRYDIKQIQIPAENTFYPEDVWLYDGTVQSVLQVDFNANYNILEEEIFSH